MRAHYFQHVPFEGLGSIEPWLKAAEFEISSTRFYQPWGFPHLDEIDFLIVLGGPMSVNDEEEYPWLPQEKQYIRDVISSGKPVLGICLGAQLIANTLDAAVHRNEAKEIGWFPIDWTGEITASISELPPSMNAFHWHGETFDIPKGAIRIAQSKGCKNQGFQLGDLVMGLQFHLESTPESVKQIVKHCGEDLVASTFIQNRQDILKTSPDQYDQANRAMATILSQLTGRL
jgi:GMP synthase-like glutamine amidotransferase